MVFSNRSSVSQLKSKQGAHPHSKRGIYRLRFIRAIEVLIIDTKLL